MNLKEANPKGDSLWLVVIECRYNVVRISPQGDGLFIPGQEPCWALDHAYEWVREIVTPIAVDVYGKTHWVDIPAGYRRVKRGLIRDKTDLMYNPDTLKFQEVAKVGVGPLVQHYFCIIRPDKPS